MQRIAPATLSWTRSLIVIENFVYDYTFAVLGEHFEKYAVCANCELIRKQHQEEKCLFGSTTFVAKHAFVDMKSTGDPPREPPR